MTVRPRKATVIASCNLLGSFVLVARMKWFRLYSEILDDPKIQKLSDPQFRDFIYMMCLACEVEKDGLIPYSKDEIAWRLRRDVTALCDGLVTLGKCHIVTDNGEGIRFLHWKKRQYASDSSAERTRRWREKQKDVTLPKRHMKRHSDGLEQSRDREEQRREEKNTQVKFDLPEWLTASDWSVFLSHRKSVRAPVTKEAYPTFIEKFFRLKNKGYEPHYVIGKMVERGWRWYKPEWDKDGDPMVSKFGEKGAKTVKSMQKWLDEEGSEHEK